MSKRHTDGGDSPDELEDYLRGFAPAEIPSELRRDLVSRMWKSSRFQVRKRMLRVAAAALVAVVPLWVWWAHVGDDAQQIHAGTALSTVSPLQGDLQENAADETHETTDVVGLQDAGTTPTESGAYRIVLVTFVHRMRETAGSVSGGRVLSERTSQSYVAVPLEIF